MKTSSRVLFSNTFVRLDLLFFLGVFFKMQSFNAGHTIALETRSAKSPQTAVAPHDPDLRFNRVIEYKPNDPSSFIFSIDAREFSRVIDSDDLSDLHKITLACRPARGGIGIWDTLFNVNGFRSAASCVLVAQNDFTPIPRNRVAAHSSFLNFARPVSRIYLNVIKSGDQVGIAINDAQKKFTHILLYEIEEPCLVRWKNVNDDNDLIPVDAVNVVMNYAIRIDHTNPGSATVLPMGDKEYPADQAGPFVGWLADTVYDIKNSYSWKPHFLPQIPQSLDRATIEDRIIKQMPKARAVSFAEFERLCRSAYQTARNNRPPREVKPATGPKEQRRGKPKDRSSDHLPIIEVVTLGSEFFVTFGGANRMIKFTLDDLGSQAVVETFLTNKDLEGILIEESSEVMLLSPSFGENGYLRYFTVNF